MIILRLMIAHASEYFCNAIKDALQEDFELECCQDGNSALQALSSFRPDALILDLMLPCKDGMAVLREADYKPDIILGLTTYSTDYVSKAAARAGIGYLLVAPTVRTVVSRIEDMLYCMSSQPTPRELHIVCDHMQRLGLSTKLDGYQQLRVGIPMFRRDTRQMLLNELYPAIAKQYDWHDPRKVEHSVRRAIRTAWEKRDNRIWAEYFPVNDNGDIPCPSNKEFISRLAELLEMA
jgi:DNA-binding response OmpR family regulator